jgi:SAM-dependent methyltransferase
MDQLSQAKESTKRMWSLGDYREMATMTEPAAEAVADACGISSGMEVLDVAAGNGNFAIAAARRGARVTASDLTPQMVEWGRARSLASGLDIDWREADAEELPFEDGRFEVSASLFGAMFAPRPEQATRELFRVVRPGGRVAMANWTPGSFIARFGELAAKYSGPPPIETPSPFLWGEPEEVRRRFEARASSVQIQRRTATFEFASLAEGRERWEQYNGPSLALRASLPEDRYQQMLNEVTGLIEELNQATDGRLIIESEYLVVHARKSG